MLLFKIFLCVTFFSEKWIRGNTCSPTSHPRTLQDYNVEIIKILLKILRRVFKYFSSSAIEKFSSRLCIEILMIKRIELNDN